MWRINERGEYEFTGSKENWAEAAQLAEACVYFKPDDEDEMVADEPVSCYNCQYRKWTVNSFICHKKKG
ncbi:MAG: hypothetical protein ACOX6I_07625 [Syntrophomonadaceae bacterium]|jgi:hypothetical protein